MPEMPAISTSKTRVAVKLAKALKAADKRMEPFRADRMLQLKEFVGTYYGPFRPEKAEPLNLIHYLVQSYLPALYLSPACKMTTELPGLRPFAARFSLAVNRMLREIRLSETLRFVLTDSFFGFGLTYAGVCAGPMGDMDDAQSWLHDPGDPFVDAIDLGRYIPDPYATRRDGYAFEADGIQVDFEQAMDSSSPFDKKLMESLRPREEGPTDSRNEVEHLSRGKEVTQDRFIDEVEIKRCWVPSMNSIVYLPGDLDLTKDFLAVADFDGPDSGPYDAFGLIDVPGNAIPVSLCGIVYDLHILINAQGRKSKRQAERQKTLLLLRETAAKDAESIRTADDGDVVLVAEPKDSNEAAFGGPDKGNLETIQFFSDWFNLVSGNPNLVGGTQAEEGTLGQSQMLFGGASAKLSYWRGKIIESLQKVIQKIAWSLWTDTEKRMDLSLPVQGGKSYPVEWTPEIRKGMFDDYTIDIEPYGLVADTPEQKYERTKEFIRDVILPLAPIGMQQGVLPDVGVLSEMMGEMGRIPRADEIFTAKPVMPPGGAMPGQTSQPSPGSPTVAKAPTSPRAPQGDSQGDSDV